MTHKTSVVSAFYTFSEPHIVIHKLERDQEDIHFSH